MTGGEPGLWDRGEGLEVPEYDDDADRAHDGRFYTQDGVRRSSYTLPCCHQGWRGRWVAGVGGTTGLTGERIDPRSSRRLVSG